MKKEVIYFLVSFLSCRLLPEGRRGVKLERHKGKNKEQV